MKTHKKPWHYGTLINGKTHLYGRRADAEVAARDWAIDPYRMEPREAHLVRRRGWEGDWGIIATWRSPEAHEVIQ